MALSQESVPLDIGPIMELASMYKLVHAEEIAKNRDSLLGDGTRRKVWEQSDGDTSLGAMAKTLKISSQAVGQHTKQLVKFGLVRKLPTGLYLRMLED